MSNSVWHEKIMGISGFDEDSRGLKKHPEPIPYRFPVYDNNGCCLGFYKSTSIIVPVRNDFKTKFEYHEVPTGLWFKNGPIKLYPPKWMVKVFGMLWVRPIIVPTFTVDNVCEIFRQFIGLEYPPIAKPSRITLEDSLNELRPNGWKWIDEEKDSGEYTRIKSSQK